MMTAEREATVARPESAQAEELLGRHRQVVLLLDDDAAVLASIRRALRGEPYHLITTPYPLEALRCLARGDVSLLICDQRMPDLAGTSFLRAARERSPQTMFAMISGYLDLDWVTEAINEVGIRWLIHKPWDDERLKAVIRRMLREQPRREAGCDVGWDHEELLVRLDCSGRTPEELARTLFAALPERGDGDPHVVVILDRLGELSGRVWELHDALEARAAAEGLALSVVDADAARENHVRVLVVTSDDAAGEAIAEMLRAMGHWCLVATTLEELSSCLWANVYDVVVLEMPGAEEFELERVIADRGAQVITVRSEIHSAVLPALKIRRLRTRSQVARPCCLRSAVEPRG